MVTNKKPKGTTLDDVAGMVQRGFQEMNGRFGEVDKRLDGLEGRMGTLEKGQEEIKLRLDNVAYRFELVELQRRVEILEKRVGAKK